MKKELLSGMSWRMFIIGRVAKETGEEKELVWRKGLDM
jgi:hypothetical protein